MESFTTNPGAENGQDGAADGTHHDESGAGHHGGIHVFVAEFERVEIPFIIALWIFCASLAKIGILFNFLRLYNKICLRSDPSEVSPETGPCELVSSNIKTLASWSFHGVYTMFLSKSNYSGRWLNDLL